MPTQHTFDFAEWLRELGMKGGEIPPFAPVVQPVQVVGDASLLTFPTTGPRALLGGEIAADVLNPMQVKLQARGEGGTYFAVQLARTGGGTAVRIYVGQADPIPGMAAASVVQLQPASEGVCRSLAWADTIAAGIPAPAPTWNVGTASGLLTQFNPLGLFIPNGWYLALEATANNSSGSFVALAVDVNALRGPA